MQKEAMLYRKGRDRKVHCFLCAHGCSIREGESGFCGVRRNIDGRLITEVYGRALARNMDPIEKKPLYHFLPGTQSYSIGAPGCNFHCDFCQNWSISQAGEALTGESPGAPFFAPGDIVAAAESAGCASISYTYTEPTIFFEYASETAQLARRRGLANVFVTNGYMTRKALETAAPYLDAANVDLKSWRDAYYRDYCKARVQPVLDTIRRMKELGIWIEITTLVIPGENDAENELHAIADFIATLSRDIPWHLSRFHPQYRFRDRPMTPAATLDRAVEIAAEHGLNYVYQGNVPGGVSDTHCPSCGRTVVHRTLLKVGVTGLEAGHCRDCGTPIPGVWRFGQPH